MSHIYTVELRFSDDRLDLVEISTRLKLQPSNSFSRSQSQPSTKKRRPYWAYNGKGEIGFKPEWENLENGLEFLLKILKPRRTEIINIAKQFSGIWWCAHFQSSFDGGPTLSSNLLKEIGSYEIPLSLDNYFSDD